MYKAYIISYRGTNSRVVMETVKALGTWFNNFENQYIICTKLTIDEIKTVLDTKIVKGVDKVLIIETNLDNIKGWLNKESWDWIKNQKLKLDVQ